MDLLGTFGDIWVRLIVYGRDPYDGYNNDSCDAESQVSPSDFRTRGIGTQVSLADLTAGYPPKYVCNTAQMIYSELQARANLSWLLINITNGHKSDLIYVDHENN